MISLHDQQYSKREDGVRHQLGLFQAYHHFCLPHASLRVPLAAPVPTNETGSARLWQPWTPAMAAGLTDHVWTLCEVLLFRVPPWPQPAGGVSMRWWEAAGGGGLSGRGAFTRLASRVSPGLRGLLGGHESSLI